ncbi:hypothetical protein [Streptomyces sp. NTH33]|uniref:hypothetical protein n=1 Tax=Streptomyces sp. NTH33 TaxID=1735453 RepID=UPI0015E88924|nr:hypothetical protein [Streptomyces sp. NTH33]
MSTTVRDNPEQSRCEIRDGETPVGFPERGITGRKTAFTPTQALTPARGSW